MTWLRRALIAVLSLIAAVILLELTAYPRGRMAARQDLRNGRDAVCSYGRPPRETHEYQKLLGDRYGVKCLWIADCSATESQVEFARGYNEVSKRQIMLKFGKDIFHECREEAMKLWQRKQAEEDRKWR